MSSPWWEPANDLERELSRSVAAGDSVGFLRRVVAAELYLPQVPKPGVVLREDAEEWVPVTRPVAGFPAIPLFTSLAGMGSAMVVGRYEVTGFAEVRDQWAGPDWWVAVNPGLPIDAYLPFGAVDKLISGELVTVDGQLVRADARAPLAGGGSEPGYDADRVLNDPAYASTREEYLDALLDATVWLPTTRVVDDPEALLGSGFPWLPSPAAAVPTIEVFTSAEGCADRHPDRPSVRVSFLLVMLGWPAGHALTVNPDGPVRLVCSAGEVSAIQRRIVAE